MFSSRSTPLTCKWYWQIWLSFEQPRSDRSGQCFETHFRSLNAVPDPRGVGSRKIIAIKQIQIYAEYRGSEPSCPSANCLKPGSWQNHLDQVYVMQICDLCNHNHVIVVLTTKCVYTQKYKVGLYSPLNISIPSRTRLIPNMTEWSHIRSKMNDLVLDVLNKDTSPGAVVSVWPNKGDSNQTFRYDGSAKVIFCQMNGYCLDIAGKRIQSITLDCLW